MKITTISVFLFLSFSSLAQGFKLSGKLTDSLGSPVSYASVALGNPTDTSTIQFVVANEKGRYEIKSITPGDYLLTIACVGFKVEYEPIKLYDDNTNHNIVLTSSAISMKEVMVRASKIPILMNGDTIIYNRESYKTKTNATVEDLLKKLPGVRVNKDRSVSAEGQNITKVLINGKEFFGGNVEAATKNIDADLVEKVEVIDQKTEEDEFTDENDNEREKVINLVLNEDKTQGYFGTIRAGYGSGDYYDGHGNINFFKDATQLSIIGGLNNITRDLFDWQEMQTLNSFEISPFNSNQIMTWQENGIVTHKGGGANIHIEPSEKIKLDVSYVLGRKENLEIATADAELYISKDPLYGQTKGENNGIKNNHLLSSKLFYKPDTLNRILVQTQFSFQDQNQLEKSRTINFFKLDEILNSGVTSEDQNDENKKLNTKITWTHLFKKNKKNNFRASFYFGRVDNNSQQQNYFNTADDLLPFPQDEEARIIKNLNTSEQTLAYTLSYTKKFSKRLTLEPGVNYMMSMYDHQFDWLPKGQSKLLSNSPYGSIQVQDFQTYARFNFKIDSFTDLYFTSTLIQQFEKRQFTTDKEFNYDFERIYFNPSIYIRTNKPHKYNGYFSFRGSVNRPNVRRVLPHTDNSDPYRIIIGNINLQNNMRYFNNYRYQRMFGLGKTLFIQGWNSLRLRPASVNTVISDDNYATLSYENLRSRIYTDQTIGLTWPIIFIKATVGLNIDYNYGESYSIQNNQEILTTIKNKGVGPNIQFNEFDFWSLDIDYRANYQTGSVNGVADNGYLYHELDAELIFQLTDKIEYSNSLYLEIYGKNNVAGQKVIPIWTSELNYNLGKNNKWSIGLKAFDILDKNQNLWRWWANNNYTQTQINSVQRYIMGTITYKIKNPKMK